MGLNPPTANPNSPSPPPPPPPDEAQINGPRKTKRRAPREQSPASSSSSTVNNNNDDHTHSHQRGGGIRIGSNKKKKFWFRRNRSDVEAIAFPLGMSIAAVLAQVLDRKDLTTESTSVDHLSMICTSAVRESLTNVFGDKFDAFARNFEKSFGSTLSTIRLIRNSSIDCGESQIGDSNVRNCHPHTTPAIALVRGECSSRSCDVTDGCLESINRTFVTSEHLKKVQDIEDDEPAESRNQALFLPRLTSQQLVSNRSHLSNHSMLTTIEKSVLEQTRANELKSLEIDLIMRKLQLKETQLSLSSDSNFLERCKLSLGITRTSFKAEKFKTQLEETRHGELLETCADFLVADLLIMLGCLGYGVYAFSYDKLHQLTNSCSPSEGTKSWWKPMSSLNSGLQNLNCQFQVYSRMLFGVLMILAIAYVLVQRSAISRQAMPITFMVLLLGVLCGYAGKFCVETLGGNGYQWLIYWEVLCTLHFFANVFTPFLFYILNGTVQVSQGTKSHSAFPFWTRRWLFYIVLFVVPICCGLLPFASPATWWEEHFSKLIRNHLLAAYDEKDDDWSDFHE